MGDKKLKNIFKILAIFCISFIIGVNSYASSDIVVALDPGHGGTEAGAVGGGLVEKNLTWKLATRVKEVLDGTPGIRGVLTKDKGETLGRRERAERAKNNNADLLVSFHINSNDSYNSLSGAEVYITHNTKQKRYYKYSNILGLNVLENLRNVGVPSYAYKPKVIVGSSDDVYSDGTIADYYGIISWPMHMDIPSVLIEHCFINNPSDRERYLNDSMLNTMAEADARAIINNKELFRRTYYGQINTYLGSMELTKGVTGDSFLKGTIDIAEWVDGNCNRPKDQPNIYLKSTDGSVNTKIFSYWMNGITYYYDFDVDAIDPNKDYYLEAYLTSESNTAPIENKTQRISIPEKTFGQMKNGKLYTQNNQVNFEYNGEVTNSLVSIESRRSNQNPYVMGRVKVEEIVNGKSYIADNRKVSIMIESTDGSITRKMFSYNQGDGILYFDTRLDELDDTKQYKIITKVDNQYNVASEDKKEKQIQLPENSIIGNYNDIHLVVQNGSLKITKEYSGKIKTQIENINMQDNGAGKHYISGNVQIKEEIDGKEMNPSTLPELSLKTEDGYVQKMYIHDSGEGNYYFDTYIEDLDRSKQYYIEAKLTNVNNTAEESEKTQTIKIGDMQLGKAGEYKVIVKENKIEFIDATKYIGSIETRLENINMNANGEGKHYISGNVQILEKVDGEEKEPRALPSLELKTEEGYSQKMYVHNSGGGNYYFDTYIEDIDQSKQYYIEAKLTNDKNIATDSEKTQTITIENKELGKVKDKKVVIRNSKIQFKDGDKYEGSISTKLREGIYFKDNGAGKHYISGNVQILESIEGEKDVPSTKPSLTLKTKDGYSQTMYVYDSGKGNYYFDTYIEDLDKSKEYYIEAKLTNTNNIAAESKKVQKVELPDKELGKVKGQKAVIKNSNIQFKDGDKYEGKISTKLTEGIYLRDNGQGKHYICGNVQIQEIIDGKANEPNAKPSLTLKTEDGYSQEMYVSNIGKGNYYFDTYIEDLDKSKEYYIEAKLTDNNNVALENNKIQTIVTKNQNLGEINKYSVKINNNKILFEIIQ